MLAIIIIAAFTLVSCHKREEKPLVTRDLFADMQEPCYRLDEKAIRACIADLMSMDKDMQTADIQTRKHYQQEGRLMWISRTGVSCNADSVLKYVANVADLGFDKSKFRLGEIESDLAKATQLDFSTDDINRLYARLEYNLTKAYMRYCIGQRFGYINPGKLLNRLDVRDSDSVSVCYQTLFDLPVKSAKSRFVEMAFNKVRHDSVGIFLRESQPNDNIYRLLADRLTNARSTSERDRILCNMERCRWAIADKPQMHKKYLWLNIPSQELVCIDTQDTLRMRVVCGSKKTKTPLLQSYIERMEINPQWIIPKSIIKNSVVHHAGNSAYFDSHRYFILERKTGKHISPAEVSAQMLLGKDYLVIQRGGRGNAMGRMVFRFNNKFSVFLHDTSNPGLFSSSDRLASHGCVRVEKPFDLAVFLMQDKDEETIEKIKYSITVDMPDASADNKSADKSEAPEIDRKMLLRGLKFTPHIPLFINYFTLYPSSDGRMVTYPDIYGYDNAIIDGLRKYM